MEEPNFDDASLVEKLIDPQLSAERLWDDHELREISLHQLAGPVVTDISLLSSVQALEAAKLCEESTPPIRAYRELFEHPAPPVRVLILVKRFAQSQLVSPEPSLPARVARLLYFTAVAVARTRCDRSISELSVHDLLQGLSWCLNEPWVDSTCRVLLKQMMLAVHHQKGDQQPLPPDDVD